MDPVPLIPKSNQVSNHDTSHIIREVFQDIIAVSGYSKNVAENAEKYNVENQNLKAAGARVISAYNGSKLFMEDIGVVEDNIMVNQGKCLQESHAIDKNETLKESLKLKYKTIFPNIDFNNTKKYDLLQELDLLPNKPEISMDFRINSNRHGCPSPCPSDLDIYPTKLLDLRGRIKDDKRVVNDKRKIIRQNERKRKYPTEKCTVTELSQRPVIFKANPETVIFKDYEKGVIYTKRFKLRNISKTIQSFTPRTLPKASFFTVELESGSTRVAPGVCVIFCVRYKTDIYKDVEEVMVFNTYTGQDVEVKLKSSRQPPNLTAFVFKNLQHFTEKFVPLEGLDFHDKGRALALNSTIDCGSCLLGNQIKFNLILKNEGTIGRFFIIGEDDWCLADIMGVNKKMELMSQAFHIYPTYFEIDTNEFVELDITFFPLNFGLEVEKLFLLCDNNTLEELEIVGDGVLFEFNTVIIQLEYKNQDMVDMDAKSSYYLDFGKCIPYQKRICRFTIHNNSIVDLKYKWEVRESICHRKATILKKMDPAWVTIQEILNYLPAQSSSDFQVTVECKTNETGLYSLVLTLYILDIPEASLVENKTFYALEEYQSFTSDVFEEKLLNIAVGEIEIVSEVVPIHIQLDPENIILPYRMEYEEEFKQKVQIYTAGPAPLDCQWLLPIRGAIEICPMQFSIDSESTFICDIIIKSYSYQDIDERINLVINNGLYEKQFDIKAKVIKPVARFSENLLNFGCVPKGKQVPGKKLYIENIGQERIYWEIFEFYFDHEHNTITELDASKHLSFTCGDLRRNQTCEITYKMDNCDQHHRWLSFLILLSSHPTLEAMGSLCLVTYEVAQPEIIIHTNSSQQPILYPGKLLYIGVMTFHMVCLHNIGTKLPASFIWGKPVGENADGLQITCTPKSGVVQPKKCEHITISLMPKEPGVFDGIYVPCFIGNMDEPIMLTILCVVDNISLYFHLPDEQGRVTKIFWPPKIISEFEGFSLDLDHFESETEREICKDNSDIYKQLNTLSASCRSSVEHINTPIRDEIVAETIRLEEEGSNNEFHLDLESSESSVIVERTNSSSTTTPSAIPLQDCFGSDIILQEHLLEYRNVPLKTAVMKTILIENVTPITGNFVVSTTNFCEVDEREKNIMDDILVKLKIKKRDEWEESINSDLGVVVKLMPEKGTIQRRKLMEIDIWVYANTWGTYLEEIVIEVNEIMPFCFNLLIEVVGLPIEFPIALNSLNSEPILRFGSIPYLSKPVERILKLTNFGCIPISLEWFVFIQKDTTLNRENDSFDEIAGSFYTSTNNLKMEEEIALKASIIHEDGIEDHSIFKIEPQEIKVNPKATETITITVTTNYFKPKFTNTEIEAHLYGFVRLTDKFKFQSNLYIRQTDINVPPAKVKILASLELPLLKLEYVKGDTKIKVYANDIIDAQEVRYEQVLVFRNADTAPATVYMHTMPPFRIVSLKTAQTNTNKDAIAAVVQPGACVEVLVECVMDADEILKYSDMLFNEKTTVFTEIPDFNNCSITLRRYLNIHQLGLKKQITTLEVVIFYPELYVSHNVVDFGVVFIGNTKKMIMTLTNPTGSPLPFTIHKPTTSSAVIITPMNGVIPKANGTTPSSVDLSLYFIPREPKVYQENIRILTNIPFHSFSVNLIGAGTNNEKFYVEGI